MSNLAPRAAVDNPGNLPEGSLSDFAGYSAPSRLTGLESAARTTGALPNHTGGANCESSRRTTAPNSGTDGTSPERVGFGLPIPVMERPFADCTE